jgi:hypothetical protein
MFRLEVIGCERLKKKVQERRKTLHIQFMDAAAVNGAGGAASSADMDRLKLYMARVEPIMASVLTALMIEQPTDPLGYIQTWMAQRQKGQPAVTVAGPAATPPTSCSPDGSAGATAVAATALAPAATLVPLPSVGADSVGSGGAGTGAGAVAVAEEPPKANPARRGIDDKEADTGESEELTPQRLMQCRAPGGGRGWEEEW